jgi:hypothetical protein
LTEASPDRGEKGERVGLSVVVALFLTAFTFALYGRALGLWWTFEDPAILLHGENHAAWSTLFVPDVYQTFSRYFFAPGVILSFSADRYLVGYRPALFYAHQLLALALAAGLLERFLRRYVSRLWSFLAAALFLVGVPVAGVASWLGVRHYVDGLVLALAAILCFRRGLSNHARAWTLASAALYLGAVVCKEIYAPVFLLVFLLPEGNLVKRLVHAIPLVLMAGLYAGWRQFMLSGYLGGYAQRRLDTPELMRLGRLLVGQAATAVFGVTEGAATLALGALALAFLIVVVRGGGAALLRVAICVAVALGPLLPVGASFEARYAFVPWAFIAAGTGWAASVWARGRGRVPAGLVLFALALALVGPANRRRWAEVIRGGERSRAEATFFFERSEPRDVVREPVERGNFYAKLAEIRTDILHRPPPGHAVFDDLFFCRHAGEVLRVYGWQETARVLESLSGAESLCAAYAPAIRDAAPLALTMTRENGVLSWTAGPYADGRWAILLGEDLVRYDVPRQGRILPLMPDDLLVTLRYESAEGWRTFSPALPLRMRNGSARLQWSR